MPTNPSAVSVISSHLASCLNNPVPQASRKRLSDGGATASSSSSPFIDLHISANAKLVLMTKIEFQKAETSTSNAYNDNLKAKYVNLTKLVSNGSNGIHNGKTPPSSEERCHNGNSNNNSHSNGEAQSSSSPAATPVPKRVLYPPERIQLKWCRQVPVGVGLVNCGNTCFLNSTLQALTHTAPLYNYLVSEQHSHNCKMPSFCMLCEMERHMITCYGTSSNRAIEPTSILQKLHVIAKHLRLGRQEDAHEFLRFAVEKMQQACLNGYQKLDPEVKETTAMNAIFGGSIKSTVICQSCNTRSDKIDPIMDLCLELKQANSLIQAIEHFIKPETLAGENAYKCPSCKKPQPACKMLTIQKAPNILTFQLKRFGIGFSLYGGAKITKQIEFGEKFHMRRFMSTKGPEVSYSLYAVVVHEGMSANSGHYYAYVKHNQQWFVMNDTVVKTVSIRQVLASQAYILFYTRDVETPESSNRPPAALAQSSEFLSKSATPSPVNKPATIPASHQPIRMVIRLPQQNNNAQPATPLSVATTNNPPKITSYSSLPLVAKRSAQSFSSSTTSAPTTPVKTGVPSSSSSNNVTTPLPSPSLPVNKPPPPSVVVATRPLVDDFASSSDDEDNKLVIDELATGGSSSLLSSTKVTSSSTTSTDFSRPRQKLPSVEKTQTPVVTPRPLPQAAAVALTPNKDRQKSNTPPLPVSRSSSSSNYEESVSSSTTNQNKVPSESSISSNSKANAATLEDGEVSAAEETRKSPKKRRKKRRRHQSSEDGEEADSTSHRHSRKRKVSENDEDAEEHEADSMVNGVDDDRKPKKKKKKKNKSKRHRHHSSEGGGDDDASAEVDNKSPEELSEWVEKPPSIQPEVSSSFSDNNNNSNNKQHSTIPDPAPKGYPVVNNYPHIAPSPAAFAPALTNASFPLPPNLSSYSLGSHVTSWDGGLNSIDSQLIASQHSSNGRHLSNNDRWKQEFDDDLDAGRQKRVRHRSNGRGVEFESDSMAHHDGSSPSVPPPAFQGNNYSSGNAFQAVQNARNTDREGSAPRSHGSGSRRNSAASSRVSSPDRGYAPSGPNNSNNNNNNSNNNNGGYSNGNGNGSFPRKYPPQHNNDSFHHNYNHQPNNDRHDHYNNNNDRPSYDNNNNNDNNNHHNSYNNHGGDSRPNQQYYNGNNNGYHQWNFNNNDRFSRFENGGNQRKYNNNNNNDSPGGPPHRKGGGYSGGGGGHPLSAPRMFGSNWRGGGGGGGGGGNRNNGGMYRRQYSLPYQQ